jgi:hypothetical protein
MGCGMDRGFQSSLANEKRICTMIRRPSLFPRTPVHRSFIHEEGTPRRPRGIAAPRAIESGTRTAAATAGR